GEAGAATTTTAAAPAGRLANPLDALGRRGLPRRRLEGRGHAARPRRPGGVGERHLRAPARGLRQQAAQPLHRRRRRAVGPAGAVRAAEEGARHARPLRSMTMKKPSILVCLVTAVAVAGAAPSASLEKARQHFKAGENLFRSGDYEKAIAEY